MKRGCLISLLILSVFLLNFVSALTVLTSPTSISQTLTQGQSITFPITYVISNSENGIRIATVNINFPSGMITSDVSVITVQPLSDASGTVNLRINASISGTFNGNLYIDNKDIPITLTVSAPQQTGTCKIYTLPIPLSKTIEKDTTATQSIDVYVSKYCDSTLTIATNQPQMLKPIKFDSVSGLVEPSGKFTITVNYDSRDVQTGTYTDNIVISGVDENEDQYSLTIPLSLTVTQSITPLNNGTFFLPSCSINSNEFSLNSSYKLICNSLDPNIQIQPDIDTSFLIGIPPYVEQTSSSYTYSFKPIKMGTTTFKAKFLYKNAPVGSSFLKEIFIGQGNVILSGNLLSARFYPELFESVSGIVTVRIIDNSTGMVYDDSQIYLDGILISNNILNLVQNKKYELRAIHSGYAPLIQTISIEPKAINFTLKNTYVTGETLDFQTTPPNSTIFLDDEVITLPYKFDASGNFIVTATSLGYTSTSKNITVLKSAIPIDFTLADDAKIGRQIYIVTDRNDSILSVSFNGEIINSTKGQRISILPKKAGSYVFYSDSMFLKQYDISAKRFYATWWFWAIFVLVVLTVAVFLIRKYNMSSSEIVPGQGFSMEAGGMEE